ncbi:aldo/keto reductase [Sulfitobacter sp. S190]|uniref:aldo/keto reductase n=1 Tax=Sulfitobacter sp. S190 TaxID=2867022 RepID=UPI0021A3A12E|nr:aldo/keto reductase [Sulfitobacter sp. S190]UWR21769.1 aldo/keto reductase [Sulfitobacter sp. S190]
MRFLDQDILPMGMGCWAIGGQFYAGAEPHGFPGIDDAESERAIRATLEAGLRVFDTAAVYGAGHSERVLGRALKGTRDAIVVSKLGTAVDEDTRQVLHDETEPGEVMPAIERSLRRLGRDHVDVMLLHLNALPIETARPIFEQMERARAQGKLRAYGWSTDFPESIRAMCDLEGFVGVEHAMNIFVDVPTIQKTVSDSGLVALLRSPLAMGVLTGKYDSTTVMPDTDVRSVNSVKRDYFQDAKPAAAHLRNLAAIRELLQTDGRTLGQGALCWLLAKSDRNIPVPGARTERQAAENAGAVAFGPLPAHVMAEIETLIDRPPEGPPRAR